LNSSLIIIILHIAFSLVIVEFSHWSVEKNGQVKC
jgi:hypothetical protein